MMDSTHGTNSQFKRSRIDSIIDSPEMETREMSPDRPDSPLASIASAATSVLDDTTQQHQQHQEPTPRIPTPKSPVEAIGAALLAEFSGKFEQQQQQQQPVQVSQPPVHAFAHSQVQGPPSNYHHGHAHAQQAQTTTTTTTTQPPPLLRPISPSQLSTTAATSTAAALNFARPRFPTAGPQQPGSAPSLIQLQAQMAAAHFHLQKQAAALGVGVGSVGHLRTRLSGPIRAAVNIRHGVWAPRLRCRKRKNLHAKSTILIPPNCTVDQLIAAVKSVLPDDFVWNPEDSPLRYQAVNDQSLQSLKPITPESVVSHSLYSIFDVVRNRRSDGDNFVLQLYVYGTWMALLKHPQSATPQLKYFLPVTGGSAAAGAAANGSSAGAANLPCVTLEMKVNGNFVRAEVSKRSFLAAFKACQESISNGEALAAADEDEDFDKNYGQNQHEDDIVDDDDDEEEEEDDDNVDNDDDDEDDGKYAGEDN